MPIVIYFQISKPALMAFLLILFAFFNQKVSVRYYSNWRFIAGIWK